MGSLAADPQPDSLSNLSSRPKIPWDGLIAFAIIGVVIYGMVWHFIPYMKWAGERWEIIAYVEDISCQVIKKDDGIRQIQIITYLTEEGEQREARLPTYYAHETVVIKRWYIFKLSHDQHYKPMDHIDETAEIKDPTYSPGRGPVPIDPPEIVIGPNDH